MMRGSISYNRESEWGVKYSLWPPQPWPYHGDSEPNYYPEDEYYSYSWDGSKVVATPTAKYHADVEQLRVRKT